MQNLTSKLRFSLMLMACSPLMFLLASPIASAAETASGQAEISNPAAQQSADEAPEKFVQRYLNAVSTAKSLKQLLPYMKPRADRPPMPEATSEEDKMMEAKMMAAVLEMQRASTPRKVEVTGTDNKNGKVILLLKAVEVAPEAKLNLTEKGALATGKIVLEKSSTGWLIADQYWHYVYPNGLTTDTGHDPDAAPKVASPIDKYSDDIMEALNKIWPDPAKGSGQVTVELKNSRTGQFEIIGVSDKKGSKEAETDVRAAIAKISLPPLPDEVLEQPIVNIQLNWSPKSKDTLKVVQLLHSPTPVK